jgi:hypothetical protein
MTELPPNRRNITTLQISVRKKKYEKSDFIQAAVLEVKSHKTHSLF